MRLKWLSIIVFIFPLVSNPSFNSHRFANAAIQQTSTAHDAVLEKLLKQFIHKHANCSRTEWACKRNCRLQFVDRSTGLCKRAHPHDQCFGIPIRYNYTEDAPDVFATLDRYQILNRFPRCWSALGPLLCAVAYRPCSNRSYFELTMAKPGFMEMWQVLRKDMCHRAIEQCAFVVVNGLWPSFINCSHTPVNKIGRQLFSDGSCEMPYNKEPAVVGRSQCLWPLVVSAEAYRDAVPLIDDCYMPCRSPLLSSEGIRKNLLAFIFTVSLIVVLLSSICFGYTSFFSSLWLTNLCVYTLGHALLSATIHWLIWMTGFFDGIAQSVMCVASGRIRRDTYGMANGALQWCNIESWLLHTSLLSAFLWLCCFLVLRVGHAPIRKDHCIYVDGRPEMSIRCVLLVIYLVAAIVATIGLWMNTAESDGIMGVCYVGLRSLSNASIFIYVPILISVIGALLMAACLFIRRRYLALLELDAEEENARRQEETVKPVDNERFSDTTHSRLGSTSAAESQPFMNSDDSSVPNVSVEEGNAIIKEREPISNDKDNPKVEEGITTEAGESRPPRRIYRRKKDGCGYTAISRPWLYALLLSIFISILASWVTHLNIGVEPNWERRLVLNSISCSLNETIRKGNDVWVNASHHSDHIISTADPLFRRRTIGVSSLSAPSCELPTTLDDHLLAVLLTFIVFPSIPFVIITIFFISGFCGYGLRGIEKIRPNLNPFIVEKVTITHTSSSCAFGRSQSSSDELELLPVWSSTAHERVSKWTGSSAFTQAAPTRICSSANCLNQDIVEEGSTHSQALSEPADPKSERPSRTRRLNILERSAERRRYQKAFLSSSAISEVKARLSRSNLNTLGASASDSILLRSEPTMNSTDVRSTYSGWSPCSEPSAFNMTSASQQRDPGLQTAAVVSAYQTGLIEGRYQERCNRYADQIRYLTESLDHANRELCRISGLPEPTASCLNRTFPAASEVGMPVETSPQLPTGFDMRSVPILDSHIVTQVALASSGGNHNVHVSKPSTSATSTDQKMETVMNDVSRTDSSQADIQRNEKCVEGQSRKRERQTAEATKDSLASAASRPTATAKASKDVISEEGEREEWMVDESEDSNTFNSEEEDSEEERLFNEMLKEMKQEDEKRAENNMGENKSGETPTLLSAESDSASPPGPSTSRRSKFSSDSADPSSMTATNSSVGTSSSGAESSRPTYILPSLNPPILRQGNVQSGNLRNGSTRNADAGRQPLSAVGLLSGPGPAGAQPHRGVILTAEQRDQLQQLRNQLTESDLMNWSEYFRRLAFERARNRAMAQALNAQQQVQAHMRGIVPAAIREEEEEIVMDPFSNADNDNNGSLDEGGGGASADIDPSIHHEDSNAN